MYSLLHYTCCTCFGYYLHPSSGAQTAECSRSRRYVWLLWCDGSWIVRWSRLRLGKYNVIKNTFKKSMCISVEVQSNIQGIHKGIVQFQKLTEIYLSPYSCRCWRCTFYPCKGINRFLVNFWNRAILLWTHGIYCIKNITKMCGTMNIKFRVNFVRLIQIFKINFKNMLPPQYCHHWHGIIIYK
jgi:hypothetical protein